MKIKEMFNWVKKIFKVLSFQDEESQMREDIVNLESFYILDNREDIELRHGYTLRRSIKILPRIVIAIFCLSLFKDFIDIIGVFSWLFLVLQIILIMCFIFFLVELIVSFLYEIIQAQWIQKYYHLISLSLLSLFYSSYIDCISKVFETYLIIKLVTFLGATLSLWIFLSLIVKKQSVYQLEEAKFSSNILVAFVTISSTFLKVKWELNFWGIFVSLLTISNTLILLIDQKVAKGHTEARKIFEKQLLLYNPDYEELKKCCFYGGEKYKEKLLNTEKFLQLIKKREVYNINYKRRSLRSRRRK